jgi:predicted nucleic acid-binding protein
LTFVLDPSVAVKWFLGDETSADADSILDRIVGGEDACAPALFRWEFQNVMLSATRADRITAGDAEAAMESLRDLPIRLEKAGQRFTFGAEYHLAAAYGLSVYDAAYLALAVDLATELVTADIPLDRAARDLGLQTVLVS